MDLKNKLKGIPHIYYFNLDSKTNRKEYMESQFNYWGISNYTRISSSKYLASKVDEWIHLIDGSIYNWGKSAVITANAINHIEFIKWWLENTNDPYMILMEDDYDLSLIEYWHFDWEYLMNNIPYDWDCIQLGYESYTQINFFLSPKQANNSFFGPCMINRRYAQKIVDLHYNYDSGKFIMKHKLANIQLIIEGGENSCNVDYFVCEGGRTYCIPLITTNDDLPSYENDVVMIRPHHAISRELYYHWWKNERDKFTLEDFFTYNKHYDFLMIKKINL
jgi:hypothetical protein